MPALSARGPLLLVGVASLAALAVCAVGTGRGAPPTRQGGPPALAPARAGGARPDLVKRFNPAGTCTRCHNVAEGTPNPPANTPQYQLPALVRLDEYRIWNEQDKHRGAYAPLLADRGKRIGQALGINVAQE
ncbi:MAG TPA: hypothetical protein VF590_18620, partial [Isosphaeraceae bacterium]